MKLTGQLLLPDSADTVRLAPGSVTIADGVITQVAEDPAAKHGDTNRPDTLICPAFTDTHLHLPQFDIIGAHGLPLLDWLAGTTFPTERRWEDASFARAMAGRVIEQLLAVGTTGIAAYATVHADATRAALEVAQQHGLRGAIGHVLMDREAPDFLTRPAAQLLDETSALLSAFPPGSRLAAAVTPRFAITCTPALLEGAGKLAQQHSALVQSHLAETKPECAFVHELFAGVSYVDVYKNAGLLSCGAGSLWGHGIYLDDTDRATLKKHGATIAHCPTANSFLRSGAMSLADHRAAGVAVTLGSDIGGGYERSMVRVARAMIETACAKGDSYPTAAQAWHQITAGNAGALPMKSEADRAGVLRVGASADVLVIEPDVPWQDHADPLAMLLWAWDDRWLKRTIVRGAVGFER